VNEIGLILQYIGYKYLSPQTTVLKLLPRQQQSHKNINACITVTYTKQWLYTVSGKK